MTYRVYYGCQAVYMLDTRNRIVTEYPTNPSGFVHGVQSLSVNNNLVTEAVPDIGRTMPNILENQPNNEITLSRILTNLTDPFGYKFTSAPADYESAYILKHENFGHSINGVDSTDIPQYDLKLLYIQDNYEYIPDNGKIDSYIVDFKRCLLTSISYEFSVDKIFTETLTFINKIADYRNTRPNTPALSLLPIDATNKVLYRPSFDTINSVYPTSVAEFMQLGNIINGLEVYGLTNVSINISFNYTQISDVGRWQGSESFNNVNRWTTLNIPLNITCSYTVLARTTQQFDILNINNNSVPSLIRFVINNGDGTYSIIDLGSQNKLTDLSISGGDTSGGNVEYTFSYENKNNDYIFYRTNSLSNVVVQTTEIY